MYLSSKIISVPGPAVRPGCLARLTYPSLMMLKKNSATGDDVRERDRTQAVVVTLDALAYRFYSLDCRPI